MLPKSDIDAAWFKHDMEVFEPGMRHDGFGDELEDVRRIDMSGMTFLQVGRLSKNIQTLGDRQKSCSEAFNLL